MAAPSLIPSGDYRTSYAADTTIFPTTTSRNAAIVGTVLICFAPQLLSAYALSVLIQIGIFAIAALGLNILVGFTGQISIGHAAFFLFGAFTSAYLSNNFPIPVFFAIPLAGVVTALVGLLCGVSGVLTLAFFKASDPSIGTGLELQVVAAVVIGGTSLAGGTGTLLGAFLGMLVISMIGSGLVFYGVSGNWAQFVTGVVIVAAIALDRTIKRRRTASTPMESV